MGRVALRLAQRRRHSTNPPFGMLPHRPQALPARSQAPPRFALTRSERRCPWGRCRPLPRCRYCCQRRPSRHRPSCHSCCRRRRIFRNACPECHRLLVCFLALLAAAQPPRDDRVSREDRGPAAIAYAASGPRSGRVLCQRKGCWRPAAWKKVSCALRYCRLGPTDHASSGTNVKRQRHSDWTQRWTREPSQTVLRHFKWLQTLGHPASKKN